AALDAEFLRARQIASGLHAWHTLQLAPHATHTIDFLADDSAQAERLGRAVAGSVREGTPLHRDRRRWIVAPQHLLAGHPPRHPRRLPAGRRRPGRAAGGARRRCLAGGPPPAPRTRSVDRRFPASAGGQPAAPSQPLRRPIDLRRRPVMTVRPITIVGHRALEQRTRKVREITEDIRTLVADMFETNDAADGAGLAAPQVGSRWRLFIYSCPDAEGIERRGVVINPRLERYGPLELEEDTIEGCLSVPGEGFPTARHRGAR